jgi:hypothetical protein
MRLAAVIATALLVLAAAARMLRIGEFRQAFAMITHRFSVPR